MDRMIIDEMYFDEYDYEEEERMMNLDEEIDDYERWEEAYLEYVQENLDNNRITYINKLIDNYRDGGNSNNWKNWSEVSELYKLEIIKILLYQVHMNLCPDEIFHNDKAYYNYLLFLANVLRNL